MSVIHHLVYMAQPVKIISMDTLVNVNKVTDIWQNNLKQ